MYSCAGLSGVLIEFCACMIPAPVRLLDAWSIAGQGEFAREDAPFPRADNASAPPALLTLIIKLLERLSKSHFTP